MADQASLWVSHGPFWVFGKNALCLSYVKSDESPMYFTVTIQDMFSTANTGNKVNHGLSHKLGTINSNQYFECAFANFALIKVVEYVCF